jgi:long-chain acyl-CoA synthetase
MNIAQCLDRSAQYFPNRPAIIFGDRCVSYSELRTLVDRAAFGLVQRGIRRGDRVGLFLPNIPEFCVAYFAAQKVGAVAVSLNVMVTTHEIRYLLADSGTRLLFTTAQQLPAVEPLLGTDLQPEQVILCEGEAAGLTILAELGPVALSTFDTAPMDPNDPAAILYTSGTTGRQKGATLSHANVTSNVHAVRECLRIDPADRLMLYLPLFHCFGQNFIMNSGLASGATLVMHRRFEPDLIVESIESHGVTMFFGVPAVYIRLLNTRVDSARLSGVRYYFSAAAALPAEIAERWCARFGKPIHEGYGLTETSPFATYNHEWNYRLGSQGTPIPLVDIKIVDENDHPVAPGRWGEVCIRGPNVMLGYWKRPDATAEALRGGWFHSNDVGYVDETGYLFIVDRTKDMINSSGFKVWPREVEEILYEHPAVDECAVVGVFDPIKGEVARAFVVRRPGAAVDADQLEAFCRQRLATYKVPRAFDFIKELPKNATGKILKRVLREQAAAGQSRPAEACS